MANGVTSLLWYDKRTVIGQIREEETFGICNEYFWKSKQKCKEKWKFGNVTFLLEKSTSIQF